MASYEVNSLDVGLVTTVPTGAPAGVVSTAANITTLQTGAMRTIAGAMEDVEYQVVSPALQINGSSATTGNLTVTFNYYQDDGSTLVDGNAFPAYAVNATVNGASVGVTKTFRTALPQGATKLQVTISPSGNAGQITAGFVLGGTRKNRAG